ncbi:hypothetical protein ZWY2020_015188 [Hordeum vulgare]|nr:hypothetical protein ZWY2020_015188 [Hordeum vulgare]
MLAARCSQPSQWEWFEEMARRLAERVTLAGSDGRGACLCALGRKTRVERRAPTAGMGGGGGRARSDPARFVLIQHRRPAAAHQTILLRNRISSSAAPLPPPGGETRSGDGPGPTGAARRDQIGAAVGEICRWRLAAGGSEGGGSERG